MNESDTPAEQPRPPSKSQQKRDVEALQKLGISLAELNPEQLAGIPLTPALEKAIREYPHIKKREALRRHRQYIGRLMREADHEAIAAALEGVTENQQRMARLFHTMEQWRDDLIAGDQQQMETFIREFPEVDRQNLRQLVQNAKQERAQQKTPANARKLFKLIRDQMGKL